MKRLLPWAVSGVVVGCYVGIASGPNSYYNERDHLIHQISSMADINGDGIVDRFERMDVYQSLGIESDPDLSSLTSEQMRSYIDQNK